MLSNFLQKPLGIVTILGAAVGGPYAAFETDVGTQLRQSLMSRLAQSNSPNSNQSPGAESTSDPFSLTATNTAMGTSLPPGMQASYWNQPTSNPSSNSHIPNAPQSGNFSATSNGQVVSRVYGPVSVQPIGPQASMSTYGQWGQPTHSIPYPMNGQVAMLPNVNLETRSGPASIVPGRTEQLWDYTLGTPTLGQIQQQPQASVGGGAINDLREVLRFDIVPGWLPQRFARVSTVTSNVQMDGLRVPLITGTQSRDIAGSLTYYFDAGQALKRINLHGVTGDPTILANLMVQFYQLKPEQSLGGQLFTSRWNNRVTSVMQVAPAPIIYAGADHSKYIIFLELNQPDNLYGLSEEASEILKTAQANQRW